MKHKGLKFQITDYRESYAKSHVMKNMERKYVLSDYQYQE